MKTITTVVLAQGDGRRYNGAGAGSRHGRHRSLVCRARRNVADQLRGEYRTHPVAHRPGAAFETVFDPCPIMPAQRLERRVPAMKRKGRIQVGADADLVAFDPARMADRSTYEQPAVASIGVVHVLVHGVPIVRDGRVVEGAAPGRAVRAPIGGAETIQGRWKLIGAEDVRADESGASPKIRSRGRRRKAFGHEDTKPRRRNLFALFFVTS